MNDRQYWLFRDKNIDECFKANTIGYGWDDFDLSKYRNDKIYAEETIKTVKNWTTPNTRHISIINNFVSINIGDIVILPYQYNIAIGEITSFNGYDEKYYDSGRSNYYPVKWLLKSYGRNNLSSDFQTTLKYKAAILKIFYYKEEIENIIHNIDKGITNLLDSYAIKLSTQRAEDIQSIFSHINNRGNLHFQDYEFEYFILELLKLAYNLEGFKNSNVTEATDGRDLILSLNYNEIGIDVQWNIQVKQHSGTTNNYAINQILRSKSTETEINVVATNAMFTDVDKDFAKKNNVILIDGIFLATLIYDNFEELYKIYPEYVAKLGLLKKIVSI